MLEHIPQDPELRHIIDLGCGNGVLSVKAGQLNPQARICCCQHVTPCERIPNLLRGWTTCSGLSGGFAEDDGALWSCVTMSQLERSAIIYIHVHWGALC